MSPNDSARTQWGKLFRRHLEDRGIGITEFARALGDAHNNISQYAQGTIRPPLEKLDLFADFLNLTGDERLKFIRLAHRTHMSQVILDELDSLEMDRRRDLDARQALLDRVDRMSAEIDRLKALCLKHGVDPAIQR